MEGDWETPWGNLQITIENRSFKMVGKIPSSTPSSPPNLLNISGTIENMSCKSAICVERKKGSTVLTYLDNLNYEATGYMIINENCDCIDIMEKNKDNKTEFKQWKKLVKKVES